jgi:protein-disulfide isomerase
VTSSRASRQARQEEVQALRAQAARAEAQRRRRIVAGVVAIVVVLAVVVFVVVQGSRRDQVTSTGSTPGNVTSNNSIVVGDADAPVTLVAYEDFQCPVCRNFETANRRQLDAWIQDRTLRLEYRPIAFLDRASSDNYSTRALSATAAVVTSTPRAFAAFHQALFDRQPAEGGPGLTDEQLVELAVQAGAPRSAVQPAIENGTYELWAAKVTEDASKAGINQTPTLIVNGTTLPGFDPATVKQAVETAKGETG